MSNDNATLRACREALAAMEQAEAAGGRAVIVAAGQFNTFRQWVDTAKSRLAKYGGVCFDAAGRRCLIGTDFMRARDEGAFPVYYGWETEPVAAPGTLRSWRTLLDMCEAAMLSDAQITELNQARAKCPPPYVLPEGWAALTRHDAALAILAALADAMGVTGGGHASQK